MLTHNKTSTVELQQQHTLDQLPVDHNNTRRINYMLTHHNRLHKINYMLTHNSSTHGINCMLTHNSRTHMIKYTLTYNNSENNSIDGCNYLLTLTTVATNLSM